MKKLKFFFILQNLKWGFDIIKIVNMSQTKLELIRSACASVERSEKVLAMALQ